MGTNAAGVIAVITMVLALALTYRPLNDYLTAMYTSDRHLHIKHEIYQVINVNPDTEQRWSVYARSVLAFSAVSVLFLYLFQRVQNHLWLALGFPAVRPALAWNTAISFTTNTN